MMLAVSGILPGDARKCKESVISNGEETEKIEAEANFSTRCGPQAGCLNLPYGNAIYRDPEVEEDIAR